MERKEVVGTGGELLVHQLLAQGVEYAFTNTGSAEAATESTGSSMATTAGRIAGLATALPGALVDSFREDVLGQHVEHEETIAARFTRLNETLDAHLVLATMMFKLHYFDQHYV